MTDETGEYSLTIRATEKPIPNAANMNIAQIKTGCRNSDDQGLSEEFIDCKGKCTY